MFTNVTNMEGSALPYGLQSTQVQARTSYFAVDGVPLCAFWHELVRHTVVVKSLYPKPVLA